MSNVTLYMAMSVDGYITGENGDVSWVGDASWQSYQKFVSTCDVVIVGRRTFIMMEKDEFANSAKYYIATHDKNADTGVYPSRAIRNRDDLPSVKTIGVIGGGDLNGSLAMRGLIDEIILDIEPVILGSGIRLFGSHHPSLALELIASRTIGTNTMQHHYRVLR